MIYLMINKEIRLKSDIKDFKPLIDKCPKDFEYLINNLKDCESYEILSIEKKTIYFYIHYATNIGYKRVYSNVCHNKLEIDNQINDVIFKFDISERIKKLKCI